MARGAEKQEVTKERKRRKERTNRRKRGQETPSKKGNKKKEDKEKTQRKGKGREITWPARCSWWQSRRERSSQFPGKRCEREKSFSEMDTHTIVRSTVSMLLGAEVHNKMTNWTQSGWVRQGNQCHRARELADRTSGVPSGPLRSTERQTNRRTDRSATRTLFIMADQPEAQKVSTEDKKDKSASKGRKAQ
jgi:hypothetical protein